MYVRAYVLKSGDVIVGMQKICDRTKRTYVAQKERKKCDMICYVMN